MSLLGNREIPRTPPPDKDSWYRCPACPYKTKQRKGLPYVAHNCPVKKRLETLREDQ